MILNRSSLRSDFPKAGLFGSKVLLIPFCAEDISIQYISWLQDHNVLRFSNQRFFEHNIESSHKYLASFAQTDNLFLSLRNLEDGCAIGTMTAYASLHHGTVDMGILIGDRRVWSRGLGQDAWNILLNWLLCNPRVRKVTAGCAIGNMGMVRLMKKSGMLYEATLYKQELIDGKPHDIVYYARFRDE